MSYNGSGTFVINTAGQPVVSGTVISSTAFNALTADLATGLSTCITKDGQTTPTANIPMGNNKITGLAVGTAATDAANLSQVQSTVSKLINSISGADTITGTMSPTLGAYATGQMFYFIAAGDNTGAVTLNIDSLGAKAVTRDGSVALAASDLKSGEVVVVVYDGTRFQVVSQLNSAGDARFANVSIASALNVGGVATFSAGTAAAPSITTSGDTNTGIFFPAADTIAFAEGGVESARFNSSGQLDLVNNPILTGGTANGVLYLNGSKVATSGSALVFDGTNLGIGTASPGAKLDVVDTAASTVNVRATNSSASAGAYVQFRANSDAGSAYFGVSGSGNAVNGGAFDGDFSYLFADSSSSGLNIGTGAAVPIRFYTNGSSSSAMRMLLDSSGNLGLGVTPSAWNSTYKAMQVTGSFGLMGGAGAADLYANAFLDSGSAFRYVANGAAAAYSLASGQHRWFTAPSGTAGNTISFTQAMTLDASGNLGIGITNPADRLSVYIASGDSQAAFGNSTRTNYVGTQGSTYGALAGGDLKLYASGGNAVTLMADNASGIIKFATGGNTERARITSGGDLLVGTTSTTVNTGNTGVVIFASGRTGVQRNVDGNDSVLQVFGSAGVAYVQGDGDLLNTNGSYGTLSDIKLKADIVDAGSQWADIKAVRFRKFKMKDDPAGLVQLGVVAQELEQVSPGLVDEHADRDAEGNDLGTTTKSVKTSVLLMKAAVALQEAMSRIEQLEAKVAALETK